MLKFPQKTVNSCFFHRLNEKIELRFPHSEVDTLSNMSLHWLIIRKIIKIDQLLIFKNIFCLVFVHADINIRNESVST